MYYFIWQFGIANFISGGDFSSFSFIRGQRSTCLEMEAFTFWELFHWLNNNGQSSWHYFLKVELLLTSICKDTSAMVKYIRWAYLFRKTIETWSGMQKCLLCEQKLSTNCIIMNGHCKNKLNGLWSIACLGCTLGCYSAVIAYQINQIAIWVKIDGVRT